jgi:DNA-binding CsgD family transcriptional regulator
VKGQHDHSPVAGFEQQREALDALVCAQGGALVLWDEELRLVWSSADAALGMDPSGVEGLNRAAAKAWPELQRQQPMRRAPAKVRHQLSSSRGSSPVLVEFSWVRARCGRSWLLGQLQSVRREHPKVAVLTVTELRVLRLLVRGLSNREIKDELCVSLATVKTHVANILGKLEVSSRSKAARVACESGLVASDVE